MNLRPRDRIALCVVLVAAIVGGYYVLALKPEQKKASSLQAAIATQQQKLITAQESYAHGRAAEASLKAAAAQWSSLGVAVPAQSDIPGLLRTLDKTAKAAHVQMQAITLSGASSGGTPAATPTTTSASPATSSTGSASGTSGATGVPISLTFEGGYVALDHLVQRLDALVTVSGGKVHATGPLLSIGDVSLSGAPHLTVQLTATIYQLDAPSTAAATGGP